MPPPLSRQSLVLGEPWGPLTLGPGAAGVPPSCPFRRHSINRGSLVRLKFTRVSILYCLSFWKVLIFSQRWGCRCPPGRWLERWLPLALVWKVLGVRHCVRVGAGEGGWSPPWAPSLALYWQIDLKSSAPLQFLNSCAYVIGHVCVSDACHPPTPATAHHFTHHGPKFL